MTDSTDDYLRQPVGPARAFTLLTGRRAEGIRRLRGSGNEHWMVRAGTEQLVLRRFNRRHDHASIAWEFQIISELADRSWPVASAVAGPEDIGHETWALLRRLPGRQMRTTTRTSHQRGQLLARLHDELFGIDVAQRPDWQRHDVAALAILEELDEAADAISERWRDRASELIPAITDFAYRTADALSALDLSTLPSSAVHGDLMPWNILTTGGTVSGVLDFEKAHVDLHATDLAFATWGGRYESDVLAGYLSARALPSVDPSVLRTLWAGTCLAALHRHLSMRRLGRTAGGLGWAVEHALRPWGP